MVRRFRIFLPVGSLLLVSACGNVVGVNGAGSALATVSGTAASSQGGVANTGAAANTGTPANTGTATGTAATTVTAAEPANDTGADPRVDGSTPDAEPPVTFALAVCEPDLHCAP